MDGRTVDATALSADESGSVAVNVTGLNCSYAIAVSGGRQVVW